MQYLLSVVLLSAVGSCSAIRIAVGGLRPAAAAARAPAVFATATATAQPVSHASSGESRPKKIFVLGGDGFCGWPVALHLSDIGHEVIIIDNLSRRKIDLDLGCSSLTPIATPEVRVNTWNSISKRQPIRFVNLDLAVEYVRFVQMIQEERPDTMVHFAEQRAAPYSQKTPATKRYTINNNVGATHNVLCGIVESGLDVHLVHLGTMGVYGYGNSGGEIPEGYIDVQLPGGRSRSILHPSYPGSIYHATKCLDAVLFQFYAKNDLLRLTDLHQGIVWGTNTELTARDERLINRFDYDGEYGTVLNRFLMQAACGIPLTVYGTGGQTRAFIHIKDTCKCIELAVANPPQAKGEWGAVEILNQVAETARVRDVAAIVSQLTGVEMQTMENPRNEAAENDLDVANQKFQMLGLEPTLLESSAGLMAEVTDIANKYQSRCDRAKVVSKAYWNKERAAAAGSSQAQASVKGVAV